MNNDILVSIYMLTYNHAKYVDKAISGVLMQKTDFKYELIIHDDASTDNTQEIIRRYEEENPEIIKAIYQKENQHSKKVPIFWNFLLPYMKGKYIAICEGDDYWIDENKLQKQVDFLERNLDYIVVGHNVKFIDDDGKPYKGETPDTWTRMPDYEFTIKHLNDHQVIAQSASIVHKNIWVMRDKYDVDDIRAQLSKIKHSHGDMVRTLMLVCLGRAWVMSDVMSAYRKSFTNSSVSAKSIGKNQSRRKVYSLKEKIDFAEHFGVHLDYADEYDKNLFNAFYYMVRRRKKEDRSDFIFTLKNYPHKWKAFFVLIKYSFRFIINR